MSIVGTMTKTFEVEVERFDSEWVPFRYRLVHVRQTNTYGESDWLNIGVDLFAQFGMNHVFKNMKVGDRWKFRVRGTFTASRDYWGEYDEGFQPDFIRVFQKRGAAK
jgi:hypothetical protein